MNAPQHAPAWMGGLVHQFRTSLDALTAAVPASCVSISVRVRTGGPLEELATFDLAGGKPKPGKGLAIGDAALHWLEANRRELVLDIRPEHVPSHFYRPFVERALHAAILLPVLHGEVLAGVLTVGSRQPHAFTVGHLNLIRLMLGELSPYFRVPAPEAPQAVPEKVEAPAMEHSVKITSRAPVTAPAPATPEEPALIAPDDPDAALVEADSLGRIALWNARAAGLFGIPEDEALGQFLTFFYREKSRRLIDPRFLCELLRTGHYRGRALCYDSDGLSVTCEVDLSEMSTNGRIHGFRGRFRRVKSETLLPREAIRFDFARLYDFSNRLK